MVVAAVVVVEELCVCVIVHVPTRARLPDAQLARERVLPPLALGLSRFAEGFPKGASAGVRQGRKGKRSG